MGTSLSTASTLKRSDHKKYPGERKDLKCGECGKLMRLKPSKHGPFYGCTAWPECDGAHGAHPDGRPMGIPASKQTRRARIQAHMVFDRIWKKGLKKRHEAYSWLRKAMSLSRSQAHISAFTEEQCNRLIQVVYRDFPEFRTRYSHLLYSEFDEEP